MHQTSEVTKLHKHAIRKPTKFLNDGHVRGLILVEQIWICNITQNVSKNTCEAEVA